MVDRGIVEEWLAKADKDLGFASSVIQDSVYYAQICFHYHQAANSGWWHDGLFCGGVRPAISNYSGRMILSI
jgi:hypothetical protein